MAIRAERITVGITATRLDAVGTDSVVGTTLTVRCPGAAIFLGGSDVATTTGYELPAGAVHTQQLTNGEAIYAVAAAAIVAHVLHAGV